MISPTPSGARTSTHKTVRGGRVRFHVKGLAFLGIPVDHDRPVKGLGQEGLFRLPPRSSPHCEPHGPPAASISRASV